MADGDGSVLEMCPGGCGHVWTEAHACVTCECGARVERSEATQHDYLSGTYWLCAECSPRPVSGHAEAHAAMLAGVRS